MKASRIILSVVLILILSLAGLGIAAWLRAPRLLEVSPAPDSLGVPPFAPLRLTFSAPMQPDSVSSRLKTEPVRNGSFSWEGNTLVFTPSQPWPSGATVTVRLEAGMRAVHRLSLPILGSRSLSFTTSQTLLAYLWPSTGAADLYALDPITGDVKRLTDSQNILDYAVSPDGQWIFSSLQLDGGATALLRQKHWGAGQTPASLSEPETILECPQAVCRALKPSPDGQWLAYERTPLDAQGQPGVTTVWLLNLGDLSNQPASSSSPTGSSGTTDSSGATSLPGATSLYASWSPSGWLAYYQNEAQRFVIQEVSGKVIGYLPLRSSETAAWSPDGKYLAAVELGSQTIGSLGTFSPSRLWSYDMTRVNNNGKIPAADLTKASQIEDSIPAYSPDGAWIAFARRYLDSTRWTPGRQLWLMRPDGSDAHPLTQAGDYNHFDFAWSLDGKQIAFVRFNQTALTEPAELWLINADGSQPIKLVLGGYAPQWIP
jgi:Tol biopolymer transport system component